MLASISWATSFLHSVFAFIIILVPLVVFHEFGHYVFARIFGVKAEVFSIGFGPRLWWRQCGETELRVSAIPMGGYVKLLGEDREAPLSPEDQKRSLHHQKAWKRFFIFFGGPLFNFILAILIFMAVLAIGEPQVASVVGRVVQGSAAEKVGFRSGDRIISIDGKPVKKFDEVFFILNENPNRIMDFKVIHAGDANPADIHVKTSSESGYSQYGESTSVGDIDGLFPAPRGNQAGVSNPHSIAGQAGIETGDHIVKFNDQPMTTWEGIELAYKNLPPGAHFSLQFTKSKTEGVKSAEWIKPVRSESLGEAFGLYSSELFVEKVVHGSPAERAGILPADRLESVGAQQVHSFFELKDAIQKSGEQSQNDPDHKVKVRWERGGRDYSAEIAPTATAMRDPSLNKTTQYTIGIMPMLTFAEPVTYIERVWNPFQLVYQSTTRVVIFCWRNLVSLKKMVTGSVSMGTLGGPIMIGKIAGESLTRGLIGFLTNMAIFSIGLGILNVLPVPVLDGGHLLLLGVEVIRGKPLTLRQMEVIQGVGLVLILALMGIAFHNDLARLIYS